MLESAKRLPPNFVLTGQDIGTGHETIGDTAMEQLTEHLQPKFGAFSLADQQI